MILSNKLASLRSEKRNANNNDFINEEENFQSQGSRQLIASSYVRTTFEGEGEEGVQSVPNNNRRALPFPRNLRGHRKNRPHHRRPPPHPPPSQQYVPTPEDLAARDPLILSDDQNLKDRITENHKKVLRKNPKFIRNPTKPIDNYAQNLAFKNFRESMRWVLHHAKQNNFEEENDNFVKTPWYQKN